MKSILKNIKKYLKPFIQLAIIFFIFGIISYFLPIYTIYNYKFM